MDDARFDPQLLSHHGAIVTSADENSSYSSSSEHQRNAFADSDSDQELNVHPDDLFDDQADEEDEAYVYKYLRSGVEENFTIRNDSTSPHQNQDSTRPERRSNQDNKPDQAEPVQQKMGNNSEKVEIKALKPRSSDAVLACPCCFNIICMDCQRHERFKDQYRAMFVMGIMVRWDLPLIYDTSLKQLVPASLPAVPSAQSSATNNNPRAANNKEQSEKIWSDEENDDRQNVYYYTVCCAGCQTTVAALDMTDEVYYFHGCIASS